MKGGAYIKTLNRLIVLVIAISLLAPLLFTLWGSLLEAVGSINLPPLLTAKYTLKNYALVLAQVKPIWILNTLILTIIGVSASIVVNSSAGFGLYLRDDKILTFILIGTAIIPRYAIVIPQFLIIRYMGLSNTLIACALPLIVSPMHILIAKSFFDQFPKSIIEAAQLDGLSAFGALFRIMLPESKHLIAALGVLKCVELWGDFLWQYVVLTAQNKKTLYLGIVSWILQAPGASVAKLNPIGMSLTAAIFLLIPFVLLFAFGSRYFMYQLGGIE